MAGRLRKSEAGRQLCPPQPPVLANYESSAYIGTVPTITLPDDELAAVTAAIRRAIEDDKFPHAPRLDPLRAALAGLQAASAADSDKSESALSGGAPHPKAPPAAKADKRARR
jgi:hypothetical protein